MSQTHDSQGSRIAETPTLDRPIDKGKAARVFEPRNPRTRLIQLAAVIVAGLLIRLVFIQSAGYHDDLVIFYAWFKSIAALAPGDVYALTPGLNYPPTVVLMYELEALVLRPFATWPLGERALNVAIKLPPILMDGAGAALVYAIIRRYSTHAPALLGAAFIAFNPAIIYDSAFWGQNDSVPTVLALFAIYELLFGSIVVAWLSLTVALFFKPPVLVLAPLLLAHPFRVGGALRRHRLVQTGWGVALSCIIAEALALVFFGHANPLAATRHLIGQYVGASNVFHYTSLNAFNLWALFGPFFASDTTKVLGLSLHHWSEALFIIIAGVTYRRYVANRSATALLEASLLVLLAFFLVLTEMHERYLYYALFFCAPLVFKRPYRTAALLLTLTLLLDLEYGLTFMYLDDAHTTAINRFAFAPWLARACSAANIGLFVWLLGGFLRRRPATEPSVRSLLAAP